MGSITSRPQVPAQQPAPVIITMPQPVYDYTPPVSSYVPPATNNGGGGTDGGGDSGGGSTPAPAVPTDDETKGAARSAGLLDRRRGVLGTVLTGFRGLLNQGVTAARKTLLGE